MIEVILNGKTVKAEAGISILELCQQHNIDIPTLCNDEELNPYGSCWVCLVEVKGRKGFVTSCGTTISEGMEIITNSEEITRARKMALELLISNHYADCVAPCTIACPDQVDIQTYISLIANGKYHEAVKVIKEKLPMPLSIGRICPAFCEKECRRQIVDESIAIRQLKRYAADVDNEDVWNYVPEKLSTKNKKIAIIGAGPSGLTCGYFLSNWGYEVIIYEAAPQAGGWLRYGIPEFRLPKDILDAEIELMCTNGMQIEYNKQLGKDIYLQNLADSYDAVYLAIGAQKAVPMPVKGSDLDGCFLGVDFLKAHALGNSPNLGLKVAIVGGGNTAVDCARTAIRKGCEVAVIYRRTKAEMPAEASEIVACENEGVKFFYLANPIEYIGKGGHLTSVKIEKMRLGEPDKSGRKRPEPTGEFFELPFDSIIAAISQVPEVDIFTEEKNYVADKVLPISRWQTAIVDETTMFTGLENVFAGGDFRRGAATAIEAIADGRIAAKAIDNYLATGEIVAELIPFDSKKAKSVKDISPAEYSIFEPKKRKEMPELPLGEAKNSFKEVELGFLEEDAINEAKRCLECGCFVNETCSLRKYCTDYLVNPAHFLGGINKHPIDYSHPFIVRDANKCINCGRCIRTCAEIQGPAVLGFIYRGFGTMVAPEFGDSLTKTSCLSCGKCIDVCPVGALTERNMHYKFNPHPKDISLQNCALCGVGCVIQTETQAGTITKITTSQKEPGFNGKNLCFKGRFGWQGLYDKDRLNVPLLKQNGYFKEISWQEAASLIAEKIALCNSQRFEISPHISLEEMLMLQRVADKYETKLCANPAFAYFSDSFLSLKPESEPYKILENYDEYVVYGELNQVLSSLIRLQQRKGKKLVLVNYPESPYRRFADANYANLQEVQATQKTLFVYNQNRITEQEAYNLWCFASKIGTENILVSTDYRNHLGFLAMKPDFSEKVADFVLGWGVYPALANQAKFSIAIMNFQDETAPVDLLIPAPSFLEIEGTSLSDLAQITKSANPAKSIVINELMRLMYKLNWIHPNSAEIPFWNYEAEKLLISLQNYAPNKFEPSFIKPEDLNKGIKVIPAQAEKYIAALFELRQKPTSF